MNGARPPPASVVSTVAGSASKLAVKQRTSTTSIDCARKLLDLTAEHWWSDAGEREYDILAINPHRVFGKTVTRQMLTCRNRGEAFEEVVA